MNNTPKLRFKGLESHYEIKKISSLLERVSNSVDVNPIEFYRQIGIRSHGKGIFYKDAVSGESLGNKRVFWVEPNVFILNIVFAWERAVAKTTDAEIGMIASHRFPMYKPKSGVLDLDYITLFFKTNRGKYLLELASPGGAGRNKTLGQKEFESLEIAIPTISEQKKIASFFSLIDKKIELQTEKVEELKNYKKGIMQKIFSQELRFKDENGNQYPDWHRGRLQDIVEKKIKGKNPIYSETGNVLLNNEFMENNTEPLFVENEIDVTKKDILILWDGSQAGKVYTGFEGVLGSTFVAITLNKNNCNIFIQEQLEYNLNEIQHAWREGSGVPHVAKDFIENYKIFTPCYEEQSKISKMLLNINEKIQLEEKKLQHIQELKRGLLQQMFI